MGPVKIEVPRARLKTDEGEKEFQSQIVRRYERRTRRVDAALLTCYLTGANTRKIKVALRPLLEGTALSRSAISRLVKKLGTLFETWRHKDLSQERYVILIMDALRLPVRLARRVIKVPVQAVLGVKESGEKELLDLRLSPSESFRAWEGVVEGLRQRGLVPPRLVLMDGNAGLVRSARETWPEADIQRCTKHKLENLLDKAPKHCHDELKRDYGSITHAANRKDAEKAYEDFIRKWKKLVAEVVVSLEEAGRDLLTFYDYPPEMWKSLRTTNMIERLNEEFRRRVKTQGSFPSEGAALTLLFGLIASGTIRLRKIDGYQKMSDVLGAERKTA
jgi:transposase-like protein